MNRITISGYVGKDPSFTVTKDGKSLARFTVAVKRKMNKEKTDWFGCIAFGDGLITHFIKPFILKSSLVLVSGELQFNDYEKKDGTKGTSSTIIVSDIELLKSGESASSSEEAPIENTQTEMQPIDDESLPF